MIFRAWGRVRAYGRPAGFAQVRWLFRAVSSVVNCVAVSPVVRWCSNGLFRFGLRLFVVIYPRIFAAGGAVV